MRQLNVTIGGLSPLLMHNPAAMLLPQSSLKVIPKPEEEAGRSAYWTKDHKSLAIPATCIHAAIIRASGAYRINRKSVTSFISGSIDLSPDMIPLGKITYQVDVRTVVIQRQRILRARALVDLPWSVKFTMTFDEAWLPIEFMEQTMPEILDRAGSAIGLLDFRPACKGRFGKFRVASFELISE